MVTSYPNKISIKRKILITGFEPYGGSNRNISQEVLNLLPNNIHDTLLKKVILPVSFNHAPKILKDEFENLNPDSIIMLGQCKTGATIRLERYAHNLMDASQADNDGFTPNEVAISHNGPICVQTGIPVKSLVEQSVAKGYPTSQSTSAGLYVCNRIYYEALSFCSQSLFIHIPQSFSVEMAASCVRGLVE